MFTFILILLILLPGAFIPVAIETFLTSDELMEMSVYLEDIQARDASPGEPIASSKGSPTCLFNIPST